MNSKLSPLWRRGAYSLAALIIFCSFAELAGRLTGINSYFQNRFFVLNRALDYPDIFKKDDRLFWRFRSGQTITSRFFEGHTYQINDYGLRGYQISSTPGSPRIMALGNSCTFGWGVELNQTYLKVTEQIIGNGCEIINGAIPGYSSLQGRRFFEDELISLKPDILLILFAWNDHWAAASQITDKEQQFPPLPVIRLQNFLSNFHSYRLLKKLLLATVEPPPDSIFDRSNIVYRVGLQDFGDNLAAICLLAIENNIRPILLSSPIPSLENYYPPGSVSNLHRYHDYYNQTIKSVANDNGVELIDLAHFFDDHDDLFDNASLDPIHFNARGHKLAGELIGRYLLDSTITP